MYLSCRTVFSPDIVLTDSARADQVFVSVCAHQTFTAEGVISFFRCHLEDTEFFSLKACLESLDYQFTGKALSYAVTVTAICAAVVFLCAVRIVSKWICRIARIPVYLLTRFFRC